MSASPARRAIALIAFSLAVGCYDRPNAAPSSDRQPDASGNVAGANAPRTDTSATALATAADTAPLPAGELPKRSHRDSVALASMTKPDSVLDRKWPVKMPPPK